MTPYKKNRTFKANTKQQLDNCISQGLDYIPLDNNVLMRINNNKPS